MNEENQCKSLSDLNDSKFVKMVLVLFLVMHESWLGIIFILIVKMVCKNEYKLDSSIQQLKKVKGNAQKIQYGVLPFDPRLEANKQNKP